MSLPSSNSPGQSSIRNFFRPKQPTYAPPPSASKATKTATPPPPPLPPPAAATTTTKVTSTAQSAITTPPPPTNASSAAPRPRNLHPQASISRIQLEHIPALRRITSLLLPVNYPDSFYTRLSDPLSSGAFSRVILWHDEQEQQEQQGDGDNSQAKAKVIGGLVCRPEPSPFHGGTVDTSPSSQRQIRPPTTPSAQPNALYIQSLVLLSPYRGLGLAASLLEEVVTDAAQSEFACETVWAHVWTQNEDGLKWYTARGFTCADEIKGYYYRLRPDSAWIVRREIGLGALLGLSSNSNDDDNSNSSRRLSANVDEGGEKTTIRPSPRDSVTAAAANLPSSSSSIPPPPPPSKSRSLPATAPPSSHPSPSLLPNSGSSRSTPGQSFQNTRPETEWNDLPPDMQLQLGSAGSNSINKLFVPGTGSAGSSRSSSAARKKRDRAYPAAAFGPA